MTSANASPPSRRRGRHWPLYLIATSAAVAVWGGWVGLGEACGFGVVHPLPGIWDGFQLNLAITLPIGVESYGVYALHAWLSPGTPESARRFARTSAIGALGLGMAGQGAYHLLAVAHMARAPWLVTLAVACLPVVTLAFAATLRHLLRAGEAAMGEPQEATDMPVAPALEATGNPQVGAGKPPLEATPEPEATIAAEVASAMASAGTPGEATDGTPSGEAIPEPVPEATLDATGEAAPAPVGEPAPEPEATTQSEPPLRPVRLVDDQDAIAARTAYRKSLRGEGKPLSDRALGEMFGKGRTWGANRIKEVNGGPKLAKAVAE